MLRAPAEVGSMLKLTGRAEDAVAEAVNVSPTRPLGGPLKLMACAETTNARSW